jgi:hypothetical protein
LEILVLGDFKMKKLSIAVCCLFVSAPVFAQEGTPPAPPQPGEAVASAVEAVATEVTAPAQEVVTSAAPESTVVGNAIEQPATEVLVQDAAPIEQTFVGSEVPSSLGTQIVEPSSVIGDAPMLSAPMATEGQVFGSVVAPVAGEVQSAGCCGGSTLPAYESSPTPVSVAAPAPAFQQATSDIVYSDVATSQVATSGCTDCAPRQRTYAVRSMVNNVSTRTRGVLSRVRGIRGRRNGCCN